MSWTTPRRPALRTTTGRFAHLGEVLVVAMTLATLWYVVYHLPTWPTDVEIYRLGAQTFLNGKSVYDELPITTIGDPLPYTYPPVSTVVFVPLALVPREIGFPALTILTVLATAVLVWVYRRSVPQFRKLLFSVALIAPAVLALVLAHPVKNTIFWGQVNVILMLMVAADCLLPKTRWPRGMLIGIAAAIKLTPAGFALLLLLRKDYRAVVVSVASFLVMTAVGFVLLPGDSLLYWTSRVFHTFDKYVGTPYANESITATLQKAGLSSGAAGVLGGIGVVLVIALTALGTRWALRTQDSAGLALGVNAAGVLLVSPISWSHHWILALPTAVLLALLGYQRRDVLLLLAGAGATMILWAAPHYSLPLATETWTWDQKIAGSSYQLLALLLLVVTGGKQLAHLLRARRERAATPTADQSIMDDAASSDTARATSA